MNFLIKIFSLVFYLSCTICVKQEYNFEYLIEPRHTYPSQTNTFLLIYIHSAPENFKYRLKIRQTWANINSFLPNEAKVMFSIGVSSNNSINQKLSLESSIYNDIIQSNFSDTYRNLTIKAVMTLKWISINEPNTKYILKVDDDVFVKTYALIRHLKLRLNEERTDKNTIMCYLHKKMKVIRDKKSKWYVTEDEYPTEYFTKYCSGSAYILTGDLAGKIVKTSESEDFFWIDDYYITGKMVKLLRIRLVEFNSLYVLKTNKSKSLLVSKKNDFVFAHFGHKKNSLDYIV